MKEIFPRTGRALVIGITGEPGLFEVSTLQGVRVHARAVVLATGLRGSPRKLGVTGDFLRRLTSDPGFTRFFSGHSTDSLKKIRQLIVDQLCAATGGPCIYVGRDMKTAHAGLGITEKDWDVSVKYLTATLDELNVPAKEKSEVLTAISGLKKDIVERP